MISEKQIQIIKKYIHTAINSDIEIIKSDAVLNVFYYVNDAKQTNSWLNLSYDVVTIANNKTLRLYRVTSNTSELDADFIADNSLRHSITKMLPDRQENTWLKEYETYKDVY